MIGLVAQLAAVLCAELGIPPALANVLVSAAVNLAAQVPADKLEASLVAVAKDAAKWLATRPPGPEVTDPYAGGNVAAPMDPHPHPLPLGQEPQTDPQP